MAHFYDQSIGKILAVAQIVIGLFSVVLGGNVKNKFAHFSIAPFQKLRREFSPAIL